MPVIIAEPPTIVVTGRPLAPFGSERLQGVTLIDRDALRNAPSSGLDQLLRGAAGVQLFRRSDSRSSHPTSGGLTLRGLGGNAASRALLTLDGVPQADPFGGWIAWSAYDPGALAEVRLVRGGGEVAQGPGAIAGAVVLVSALDDGLGASAEGGSRSSAEGRIVAGSGFAGGRIGLTLHGAAGAGFVPVTADRRGPADRAAAYQNGDVRLRFVRGIGATTEAQLSVAGFADSRDRGTAFTDNRSQGIDASLRLVGRGAWGWTLLGYGQWREFQSSFAAVDAARTVARRTSLQFHVPGRGLGWSGELRPPSIGGVALRLGADARVMRGRSEEFASFVAGTATRLRVSGGESDTVGLFGEASGGAGVLRWSAGGRVDRWHIGAGTLRERSVATGATVVDQPSAARSGTLPTGRIAVGVDPVPGLTLRSAGYVGWRLPTLNELFRPFRVGSDAVAANPALKPERLRGAEVGVDWRRGGARLSATAFTNRLIDPIVNVTVGAGPGVFPQVGFVAAGGVFRERRNAGALQVRGLEAEAAWTRGAWQASVAGALSDARMRGGALAGLRPAQTPRLSASASLEWSRDGREARVTARYAGAQFEDDQNRLRLPPATTLDALLVWPIAHRAALTLRAENALNATVVAGRTADGLTERATPRTLCLGVRFGR